jgi:hypothetical protein
VVGTFGIDVIGEGKVFAEVQNLWHSIEALLIYPAPGISSGCIYISQPTDGVSECQEQINYWFIFLCNATAHLYNELDHMNVSYSLNQKVCKTVYTCGFIFV